MSKHTAFRHKLTICIYFIGIWSLSFGWYLSAPTVGTFLLCLLFGIIAPVFPSDHRPEMTDRSYTIFCGCLYCFIWIISVNKHLISNLIALIFTILLHVVLSKNRFKLQLWLEKHPADQLSYTRASGLIILWISITLFLTGFIGFWADDIHIALSLSALILSVLFLIWGSHRISYRIHFLENALSVKNLLFSKTIPYDTVSYYKTGSFFCHKLVGTSGKTILRISPTMVGPTAKLFRSFRKNPTL